MEASIDLGRPACAHHSAGDDCPVTFTGLAVEVLEAVAPPRSSLPPPAAEPSAALAQPVKTGPARAVGDKKKRPPQEPAPFGHPSLAHIGCQVERPTQAEIRQRCLEVQGRWSAQEREARSMWPTVRWELPVAPGMSAED